MLKSFTTQVRLVDVFCDCTEMAALSSRLFYRRPDHFIEIRLDPSRTLSESFGFRDC